MNLDKIAGQTGHLVLATNGVIISSSGELENDEATAASIFKLLTTLGRSSLGSDTKKVSLNYTDHCFVICLANKKINVIKKSISEVLT